eukprot:6197814-Prymnesium_polylepis.1
MMWDPHTYASDKRKLLWRYRCRGGRVRRRGIGPSAIRASRARPTPPPAAPPHQSSIHLPAALAAGRAV